jgi:hypothetical protein
MEGKILPGRVREILAIPQATRKQHLRGCIRNGVLA